MCSASRTPGLCFRCSQVCRRGVRGVPAGPDPAGLTQRRRVSTLEQSPECGGTAANPDWFIDPCEPRRYEMHELTNGQRADPRVRVT
jgi:hypothetical protein